MTLLPEPYWPSAILALILATDAAMSIRPLKFIRDCLNGVGFPREWWWTLVVIKALAAVGLVAGIWLPGVGFAANGAVVVYFCSAAAAHLRARNTGPAFWINCLGMLFASTAAFVVSFGL